MNAVSPKFAKPARKTHPVKTYPLFRNALLSLSGLSLLGAFLAQIPTGMFLITMQTT